MGCGPCGSDPENRNNYVVSPSGELWGALGSSGELWAALGSSGQLWAALGSSGQLWGALGSSGDLWGALGSSGELWGTPGSSWELWDLACRVVGWLYDFEANRVKPRNRYLNSEAGAQNFKKT